MKAFPVGSGGAFLTFAHFLMQNRRRLRISQEVGKAVRTIRSVSLSAVPFWYPRQLSTVSVRVDVVKLRSWGEYDTPHTLSPQVEKRAHKWGCCHKLGCRRKLRISIGGRFNRPPPSWIRLRCPA